MINEVVVGITKKLKNSYKHCNVYIDDVKSNLFTPAFIVKLITHEHRRLPSNQYDQNYPFQIVYVPKQKEKYSREIYEVVSELNYILEFIEICNDNIQIRGREMSHEIIDGVLYFYVSYSLLIRLIEDLPKMDSLESNVIVKEGDVVG